MRLEKKSIKQLKNQCWKLCSEFIRRRDKGICYTCGKTKEWKEMEAGHWKHGHTKATYFEPDNIHCQCYRCNRMLSGNLVVYTMKLGKELGQKKIEEIDKLSKKEHVHNRKEVIKWIKYYIKELQKYD